MCLIVCGTTREAYPTGCWKCSTWACETGNHDKGNVKSHEWAWSKLSIIENESKGELRVASYGTSTGQNKAEEKQQENGENIPQK